MIENQFFFYEKKLLQNKYVIKFIRNFLYCNLILLKSSDFVIEPTETLSPPKKRQCVDWFEDMFETSTTTFSENKHSLHKEMNIFNQLKV